MSKPKTGKVSLLTEFETPSLETVEKRRLHLWAINAIILVTLAASGVLLTIEDAPVQQADFLPLMQLRLMFLGLIVLMALYMADKEMKLRELTRNLVNERVLEAGLSNRLKELTALTQVGKAMSRTLTAGDLEGTILQSALDLLEVEEGSLMLVDGTGQHLRVVEARTSRPGAVKQATVKVGDGVAGWVAQRGEPLLISGNAPSDHFQHLAKRDQVPDSAISVPLKKGSEVIGVLNVNARGGVRDFTEFDMRALQLFAEHAALALANARDASGGPIPHGGQIPRSPEGIGAGGAGGDLSDSGGAGGDRSGWIGAGGAGGDLSDSGEAGGDRSG